MALFNRVTKAAIAPAPPQSDIKAAVGGSYVGTAQVGNFITYYEGDARQRAMSLGTVARSRDLICTTIGNLDLEMYREIWNGDDMEPTPLAPRAWLERIDKSVPNDFILSWTADDLLMYGAAVWMITARTQDGFPSSFTRLPFAGITFMDQPGPVFFGPSKEVMFNGLMLDPNDLVQFLSPSQGFLYTCGRMIETALKVEESRHRNAASSLPSGILKQTGGEPLSASELAEISTQFNMARSTNQTAALNEFLSYTETAATPDKMLMIESADYSAKDLSRGLGVPPYLVGVSTGSYSYQNATQSRIDLWTFACLPIANCISSVLSSDNVLPRGTKVKFDVDDFINENYRGGDISEEPAEQMPSDAPPMASE